ncbi:MAG: aldo/keto reductase [Calditrichaeota bacterium]|nr:MAG: aldo/keto reductase [Calditrichota bacterium]
MATPELTEFYFERLAHKGIPEHAIRKLGKTGFRVSAIGFGGYRIHYNSIEHARALRYALLNGFNLIDTSSNYTDGGSEMLIGNLLGEMIQRKELRRDEVVVVSKVGYVQGQNLVLAQQNEAIGRPFPEMVKYMEGCWHCIHPEFLQDQLTRSLDRLNLTYLDVYLLHNPEYFLSHMKKQGNHDLESVRAEYYRRIKQAFEWMEEKVAEGKIKAYGISSNTFPLPANDFEFTSLEKVLEVAQSVSSTHYFQIIQFPLNLYETGACFEKNQANGTKTLLELAREKEIGTMVNRPLNAVANNHMIRLASFRTTSAQIIQQNFKQELEKLRKLEDEFKKQFLPDLKVDVPKEKFEQVFSVAQQLQNALSAFQNWEHWDHVKQNIIFPQVFSYLSYLNQKLENNADWFTWADKYSQTLYNFLESITQQYENQAQRRSQKLEDLLNRLDSSLKQSETLSQKVLRVLKSIQGIDCVLLGMRRTPYVEDALEALRADPIKDSEQLLIKFQQSKESYDFV